MPTIFLSIVSSLSLLLFFFFNDTATTEIYTLSLHDALPILDAARLVGHGHDRRPFPGHQVRRDGPDVAEPLHRDASALERHTEARQRFPRHDHAPPPRRLAPPQRDRKSVV